MVDLLQVDLSNNFVKASEASFYEVAQWQSKQSRKVGLFHLNGFEWHYKTDWHMLCQEWHQISLTLPLVLSHWSIAITSPVEFSTGEFRAK